MDLWSLLCGRGLWRAAEEIERRGRVWFNRPVRVVGTWRAAEVVDVNERIVEGPFVHARVRGRRVLDVGSGESLLALELASLGYEVTALDVRGYPLDHPNLTAVRDDIRATPFPAGRFDTVVALSTLEHVGLGFYGEPADSEGDRRAVVEIRRITAADGRLLLTVPFGRVRTMPGHRVYDRERLRRLVEGWQIEEFLCFRRQGPISWVPAAAGDAEKADSSGRTEAVALLTLRPAGGADPCRRLRRNREGQRTGRSSRVECILAAGRSGLMAMSRRVFCSGCAAAVAAGWTPRSFAQGTGLDPQSIVGEWTGTWTAGAATGGPGPRGGTRGPYSLTIARVEGNVVRGTIESQGTTANFRGTLSGSQLKFGNERVQTELTIEGNSMRGTRLFTGGRPAAIELTKRK